MIDLVGGLFLAGLFTILAIIFLLGRRKARSLQEYKAPDGSIFPDLEKCRHYTLLLKLVNCPNCNSDQMQMDWEWLVFDGKSRRVTKCRKCLNTFTYINRKLYILERNEWKCFVAKEWVIFT